MDTEKQRTATTSRANREGETAATEMKSFADAKALFAPFFDDERALASYSAEFFKLGGQIAGRAADERDRVAVYRKYVQRILLHSAIREQVSPEEKRDALAQTLEEMRAENLHQHSSFEARRAHTEIATQINVHDNLRDLYNPQDGRSRAEHASHLNSISQEARDAFERGATVYGDTLIVPRESAGKSKSADQIRAGTHAHAVREFKPLVGEERAKVIAAEFVELGRAIAGRTADGTTRLTVFQTFYHEITHDDATGKRLSQAETAAQVEPTLERMRLLASAMRAEEWKREKAEFVHFEDWERGFEVRQRDAEHETHGRLTYRIESIEGLELEQEDAAEHERERGALEHERNDTGALPNVEYERIPLDREPPRLPDGLTGQDERRLRYHIIPLIDRQLETGTRPRDIIGSLYRDQRAEEERALDEKVSGILTAHAPVADRERAVTRTEELRALFTLQLLVPNATKFKEQREKIAGEIARRAPTERERADAIESIGVRLATAYRAQTSRLRAYEGAEAERVRLNDEALRYQENVRAGAEFQHSRQRFIEENRTRGSVEREALTRADNVHFMERQSERTELSNYPELVGEQPPLSPFAQAQQAHERERSRTRSALADKLINLAIEQAQKENFAEIEKHRAYFSRLTGSDITSAGDARIILAPHHERVRASLHQLHTEPSQLKAEVTRTPERDARSIFVSLGAHSNSRLPVGNINEYRSLAGVAHKLNLQTRVFESLRGREIKGASRERDELYDFARQYVDYRAQDHVTRFQNENRLFRDFHARLDRARTTQELQATINDIRRENYRRAAQPEQFTAERQEDLRRNEQTRRPLTFSELRALFLAPAPTHYTDEMRDLRSSRSVSAYDKAQRLQSLERGAIEPSLTLATILREFDRTRHDSPARMARNIKAFLGDYLNPLSESRNRFSRENIYELGKRLDPAESNYVFKLINDTRQTLAYGTPVKAIERSGRSQDSSEGSRLHAGSIALESVRLPYESLSFRLYYGAGVWREAASLADAGRRSTIAEGATDRTRQTVVRGVREQDLETVAVLLAQYGKQPKMIEAAAEHLRLSNEIEHGRLGEILTTFREMKMARGPEGQLRFQITTPANSALDREEWTRLLDELSLRIHAAQNLKIPEPQRLDIKRAAANLAWNDLRLIEEQQLNIAHQQTAPAVPAKTNDLERAIEGGSELQLRARTADDALERSFASQVERVKQALQMKNLLPEDSQALQTLTRIALDPQRTRDYDRQISLQKNEVLDVEPSKLQEQLSVARSAITPHEQHKHQQFVAFAARAKAGYLENFGRIDEQLPAFARGAHQEREARALERSDPFKPMRDEMEAKVVAYLTGVVREQGVTTLEAERAGHIRAVSRIIKQTFQQRGYDLAAFNLNEGRVNTVTAKLIEELPIAIRASHERAETHAREYQPGDIRRSDHLLPDQRTEHTLAFAAHAAHLPNEQGHSTSQQHAATTHLHHSDDEFVEQKVSRSIGQIQEQALSTVSRSNSPESRPPQHKTAANELNADHHEQFTRRYILTR